jgi:hypothetical protein
MRRNASSFIVRRMRRRVLVEHLDPGEGRAIAGVLHDAGFAVATCPGPTLQEPCPVLRGQTCPLAERADVIVSVLRAHPEGRAISACLRVQHPGTPLLRAVEVDTAVGDVCAALGH